MQNLDTSFYFQLKGFLKRIPLLVSFKRFVWGNFKWIRQLIRQLVLRDIYWPSLLNDHTFRAEVFDSAPKGALLLSSLTDETYVVSVNDKTIGRRVFLRGSFDSEKIEKTVQLLGGDRTNMLLIDIGANIGTICIPMIKRGIFKRAIAIEPEPFNFSLLSANIFLNGLGDKIVTHNIALGNQANQEIKFELSDDNFGDHRVRVSEDGGVCNEDLRKIIAVESDLFDRRITIENPNQTLIWIDVQGFEGFVLAGATNALRLKTPLVIEFWPYGMKRSGCYELLKASILSAGYECFIDLDNVGLPQPVSAQALDVLYNNLGEHGPYTDMLLR
ncbi:FkbM family methyltransferase [uncultured Thiodictyon sp.]|uniref:FkbM family methyltransferase n=1 Tax=uncultured Thiodictyon sp. TaxID=1846217 RepID=UPI0025F974BC|nr:FkbM family methyltransferase [uncultured Thiodictyon sp.]